MPQCIAGRDIHFWFRVLGINAFPVGRWGTVKEPVRVLDTGVYRAAIAAGRPMPMPIFTAFNPGGVVGADGSGVAADAVIFATGFRPALEFLTGTDAVDSAGRPRHRLGISTTAPGLYYVGLSVQRSLTSATLRGVGPDAALIVRRLARRVRRGNGP